MVSPCPDEDSLPRRIKAGRVALALQTAYSQYWTADAEDKTCVDVAPIRDALRKYSKALAKDVQHDAHEGCMALLSAVHEFFGRMHPIEEEETDVASRAVPDHTAWDAHSTLHGYSFLTELIQWQVSAPGMPADHPTVISLALVDGGGSLYESIVKHFKETPLIFAPTVAIIHLKRFDAHGNKVQAFCSYETDLDMTPLIPPAQAPLQYRLYAVLCHRGNLASSGHYDAFCELGPGAWWHLNGSSVQEMVSQDDLITRDAYMLFYIRV